MLVCCAQVRNGHIKRITDNDIQSLVIELYGTNVRFVSHALQSYFLPALPFVAPLVTPSVIFLLYFCYRSVLEAFCFRVARSCVRACLVVY